MLKKITYFLVLMALLISTINIFAKDNYCNAWAFCWCEGDPTARLECWSLNYNCAAGSLNNNYWVECDEEIQNTQCDEYGGHYGTTYW